MTNSSLASLLDPGYVEGLSSLAIEEVRSRRTEASDVEVCLSYVRRLVQGRLDIVLDEARRRTTGDSGGDVADLVERLPEILGEHVRAPGMGRLSTTLEPVEIDASEIERIDAIVDADRLAALPRLDDDELRRIVDELAGLERDVSARRHALHHVIDQLQGELVRRYKSGEANVDALLS